MSGYTIGTIDGHIGVVRDVYFHDRYWGLRYVVVDTGHWPLGKRVLVSSRSLCGADHARKVLRTSLTKRQIAEAPDVDAKRPVSRQHDTELYQYYLPYYFAMADPPAWPYALTDVRMTNQWLDRRASRRRDDPHLRSAHAVAHHWVHAVDGDIGHVIDFLYDETAWRIRHLVVGIGQFRSGRRVLVPVSYVSAISWDAGTVELHLMGETIRFGPECHVTGGATPEYLARVAAYYAEPLATPAAR